MDNIRKSKRKSTEFSQSRDRQGKFRKTCDAIIHDESSEETSQLIDLVKRPKIKASDYRALVTKGIVSEQAKFICHRCFNSVVLNTNQEEKNDISDTKNTNEPNEDDFVLECIDFGEQLRQSIISDIKNVKNISSLSELKGYDPVKWLKGRPMALLQFLCSLCGIDANTASKTKLVLLSKVVELVYCSINARKVLPNHFLENLLCYSYTNSKSYLDFISNRSPGGSYTYINNWLKDQSQEPITYPDGLVKSVFDNSQKIGRTYLISETNIVKTSIITSHLWVTLDPLSKLQEKPQYQPNNWMWNNVEAAKSNEITSFLTKPSRHFRESRDSFISTCRKNVYQEHNKALTDVIDLQIKKESILNSQKTCASCGGESNEISKRICGVCGGSMQRKSWVQNLEQNTQIDPYESFASHKASLPKISCKAGEPDFVDPNGYHNIIQVIQAIGIRAGVKQYGSGSREWLMVECDGLPYNLIRDIIENVYRCSQCSACYYGINTFKEHPCYILNQIKEKREFGWLFPVFGLLHLEMNAARSFTKLNWEVFMSTLGTVLGFKSPKAQNYLRKGADHHKLWHLLEILYAGISMELMVPYVRGCIKDGSAPTVNGYWDWAENIRDPNYLYMQESILTYVHGLMMLRTGVRKCNAELIDNSIGKISHLFYGRNHPIYQNILFQHARDNVLMPSDLKLVVSNFVTGSKTNTLGKCQGADAMLEELNKETKSWLKMSGIPTNEQWLQVFRNIDDLSELKENAIGFKNTEEAKQCDMYERNNLTQIAKIRHFIRKSNYLIDPLTPREHLNISGNVHMSADLINFPSIAMDNVDKYVEAKIRGDSIKLTPVFVTHQEEKEFCSIQNKTIEEIKTYIFELIKRLDDTNAQLQIDVFKRTVNGKKKEKYIEFFLILAEQINQESSNNENDGETIDQIVN